MSTWQSLWILVQAHPLYLPFAWLFSGLTNVLVAIPSFVGAGRWLGKRRALLLIASLSLFAFLIEGQALLTGWPYGGFYYSQLMGFQLFGLVPWSLPFAYVPLVLGAGYLSYTWMRNRWLRIVAIGLLLLAIDLAFDPVATKLGFWVWSNPQGFYGVPWSNFFGWLVSGLLAGVIFTTVTNTKSAPSRPPRLLVVSLLLFLICVSLGNLLLKLWVPLLIGISLLALVCYSYRYEIPR